jgi:hypothetical protein
VRRPHVGDPAAKEPPLPILLASAKSGDRGTVKNRNWPMGHRHETGAPECGLWRETVHARFAGSGEELYRYIVRDGFHRFYASIAQ